MISPSLNLQSADTDTGNHDHAQKRMDDLGITYRYAVPQSISDSWWFLDCQNVPTPLPSYFHVMRVSNWDEYVGGGFLKPWLMN